MKDFTITTELTSTEYAKVMLIGLYRKPSFIVTTLFGCYYLGTTTYEYFSPIESYSKPSVLEFLLGLFIIFAPFLITTIAVFQFNSNPNLKKIIAYTFGEKGIKVKGATFEGTFTWEHIMKQKEISKFLVLYHSKKMGNFIDKTKLDHEQLQFIKDKVNSK